MSYIEPNVTSWQLFQYNTMFQPFSKCHDEELWFISSDNHNAAAQAAQKSWTETFR